MARSCPRVVGCALLLALCSCGPSAQEKARREAADAAQRRQTQEQMQAMRKDADGSAFRAVGDMMKDPDAQAALGVGTAPPANAAAPKR